MPQAEAIAADDRATAARTAASLASGLLFKSAATELLDLFAQTADGVGKTNDVASLIDDTRHRFSSLVAELSSKNETDDGSRTKSDAAVKTAVAAYADNEGSTSRAA